MPCMCGDSECLSCGSAQGTLSGDPATAAPLSALLSALDQAASWAAVLADIRSEAGAAEPAGWEAVERAIRSLAPGLLTAAIDDIGSDSDGEKTAEWILDAIRPLWPARAPAAPMRAVLERCRAALESLPVDAIGEGSEAMADPETGDSAVLTWSLRDELIDGINRALAEAGAAE